MTWIFLICIWYNIYKKRKEIVGSLIVIVFILFTMLFGPIVLIRYMLILFYAFPLFVAFCFNGNKFTKKLDEQRIKNVELVKK